MDHPSPKFSQMLSSVKGLFSRHVSTGSQPEGKSWFLDFLRVNWYLGFTAFGGPPVHFQIFHKKFVEKEKWIDEQLYQEIFGLAQATPGPGSTKMYYCINYIHGGFFAALFAFLIWCLPGAAGMYGLALGVSHIGDTLPGPVYALLSGLNAATVGIIALAAVQLAEKAITDKLTRVLVFLGGVAGMLYTGLWYYPVLLVGAGASTLIWDYRVLHRLFKRPRVTDAEQRAADVTAEAHGNLTATEVTRSADIPLAVRRPQAHTEQSNAPLVQSETQPATELEPRTIPSNLQLTTLSWKAGTVVLISFLAVFLAIILIRSLVHSPPRGLSVFANFYLAGTIIFGGGPVVIPLLREYIVAEGWVSPRDFLLGLAIIQAFPGPNFNFAVYLGALAVAQSNLPSIVGSLLGFIGMFGPGLVIFTGIMGLWSLLRSRRWLASLLRGVNAAAVGLVFTAVYRLWQVGYVDEASGTGGPIGGDPWWVAITAGAFVGGKWFGLDAPYAILCGGTLGLVWYGITQK